VKLRLLLLTALVLRAADFMAHADEMFFKPNDVIALVGGEDMVAAGEYGYLELLLQRALPDYHLKVRSLAWEGDTVFEQPRMLNYPKLEQQLDEIGATVVILQFGQMENATGSADLPSFTTAYSATIRRLGGSLKRRIVIVEPTPVHRRYADHSQIDPVDGCVEVVSKLSKDTGARLVRMSDLRAPRWTHRDDRHLDEFGHEGLAGTIARSMGLEKRDELMKSDALKRAIAEKNRLWDRYRRPQNWAFLAGDRTTQASSRDHRDPTKRWFPEEMKEFIPLIEAKEREIWDLASKLAAESK
jgi:hypothetical protein